MILTHFDPLENNSSFFVKNTKLTLGDNIPRGIFF